MENKKEKAKELRTHGLTYQEIGQQIGVSGTMARNYVLGINNKRPIGQENSPCGKTRPGHKIVCQRRNKHSGIHLANDTTGRLTYWE
jgi:predicted transcriptional regulator